MPQVFEKDGFKFACYCDGHILIAMGSGVELRFLVAQNPRLARGTPRQLNHIELSPFGLPGLDEDLSFQGLLAGDYGQPQRTSPSGQAG